MVWKKVGLEGGTDQILTPAGAQGQWPGAYSAVGFRARIIEPQFSP